MRSLALFLLIALPKMVLCQDLSLGGVASNLSVNGKITNKLSYTFQVNSVYNASTLRIDDKLFPSGHTHFVPHLFITRKINNELQVSAGYGFGRHNIFGLRENEHRFVIQGAGIQRFNRISFNHRIRFEQRSPKNLVTGQISNASILRYFMGASYPLYNPKKSKSGLYLHASNEAFLYLKGATNGPVSSKNGLLLSENWSNLGVGYTSKKSRIEIGYGFQRLIRNKKQDLRNFHLCQVSYFTSLDFEDFQYWWFRTM